MGGRQGSRPVWLVLVLLAAALLWIATAGCGDSARRAADDSAGATPKQGGTYNYPLSADPGSFDPARSQTLDGWAILHQLYEGLVRWEEQPDGTMKTVPCLAESWSGNADATVWTFKLRRGVMFQAPVSREVTAADVAADLRYLADPAHANELGYMYLPIIGTDEIGAAGAGPLGAEALDRYTVRFTLKYPFSEFPDTLGNPAFWVWPVDHLRKVGRIGYARHPVGTGPYQFQRGVPGTSFDLVRNADWWDTSGGPYIETIHYEVFSSVTSMMLAFQKGMVDWTLVAVGQVAASRSLPQVESGRWQVQITPNLAMRYLCANMRDPAVGGTQGLRLRQALAYGCDRQAVSDASSGGVFLPPTTGVVPPGVPGAHGVQEPYAYDPAKAKELVESIGPVTLRLAYPIGQQEESTAESLRASFAEVGITVKVRGIEFNRYVDYVLAGKAQLYLAGWVADYPSMDNFLYALFESSQSPYGHGTRYSNPKVDALLAQARSMPDEEARLQRYAEAERLILADAPEIPLIVFADARLFNSRVTNVRFNSIGWVDLWRAWVR
jgi:oligopeptide transport system substrate-binding protein